MTASSERRILPLIEIYSKEDCYLCDAAKEVLNRVQRTVPFELREIVIREGTQEYEQFKERVPVVFIYPLHGVNKEFAFQYRVPEEELMRKLQLVMSDEHRS